MLWPSQKAFTGIDSWVISVLQKAGWRYPLSWRASNRMLGPQSSVLSDCQQSKVWQRMGGDLVWGVFLAKIYCNLTHAARGAAVSANNAHLTLKTTTESLNYLLNYMQGFQLEQYWVMIYYSDYCFQKSYFILDHSSNQNIFIPSK